MGMSDGSGSLDEKISGIISNSGYVACTTAANTVAKTVTQANFTLSTNCRLIVKMANYNTAASPTLNVNNTGAKPLYYNGEVASADNTWEAGEVLDVYYDGTNYQASNIQGGAGAGGNQILKWDTNAATTRLQITQHKRKAGMIISYNDPVNGWINEQYVGSSLINSEWSKDSNWQEIPNENQIPQLLYKDNIINESYKRVTDYVIQDGKYISDTGAMSNNGNFSALYYYPIKNMGEIKISVFHTSDASTNIGLSFYDKYFNPIKGYTFANYSSKTNAVELLKNIPVNAYYIRVSLLTSDKESFVFEYKERTISGIVYELLSSRETYFNLSDIGVIDGQDISSSVQKLISAIKNIRETYSGLKYYPVTLYLPKGTYYLSSTLYWIDNLNLIGSGIGQTILMPTGSYSAIKTANVNTGVNNVTFEEFTINGEMQSANGADVKGIYIVKLTNATFRNLEIINTCATGLGTDHFINGVIDNVRCNNCGRSVDFSNNDSSAGCSGIGIGVGGFNRGNETLTISNCHCNNCGQYGIFIEQQRGGDSPTGVSIIGCTAEGNRTGFGVSGGDSTIFIGCSAYKNHHAGFAYDDGTMGGGSIGKRPKFIACVATCNGIDIPEDYSEYRGQENGFGWYILSNYSGIELISCNAIGNLKSGIEIVNGISNINIDGGEISENKENGINLNGNITSFRISPTTIANNVKSGIRLNSNLLHGLITGINIYNNDIGIEKIETANMNDSIVKDNFVYNNTTRNNDLAV